MSTFTLETDPTTLSKENRQRQQALLTAYTCQLYNEETRLLIATMHVDQKSSEEIAQACQARHLRPGTTTDQIARIRTQGKWGRDWLDRLTSKIERDRLRKRKRETISPTPSAVEPPAPVNEAAPKPAVTPATVPVITMFGQSVSVLEVFGTDEGSRLIGVVAAYLSGVRR